LASEGRQKPSESTNIAAQPWMPVARHTPSSPTTCPGGQEGPPPPPPVPLELDALDEVVPEVAVPLLLLHAMEAEITTR